MNSMNTPDPDWPLRQKFDHIISGENFGYIPTGEETFNNRQLLELRAALIPEIVQDAAAILDEEDCLNENGTGMLSYAYVVQNDEENSLPIQRRVLIATYHDKEFTSTDPFTCIVTNDIYPLVPKHDPGNFGIVTERFEASRLNTMHYRMDFDVFKDGRIMPIPSNTLLLNRLPKGSNPGTTLDIIGIDPDDGSPFINGFRRALKPGVDKAFETIVGPHYSDIVIDGLVFARRTLDEIMDRMSLI